MKPELRPTANPKLLAEFSGRKKEGVPLRVLYVLRSLGHFAYHETVLNHLVADGAHVQLVFDPRWSKDRSTDYVNAWIEKNQMPDFKWAPQRFDRWRKPVFKMREIRSYCGYLKRTNQSKFYLDRWEGYLSKDFQKLLHTRTKSKLIFPVLKSKAFRGLLLFAEQMVPACSEISKFIESENADVVVVSPVNMRYSEEVEFLKSAKALNIPTATNVLSWDNLTTKGLFHVRPDLMLAWNETHLEEAATLHRMPSNQIAVSGSPFFDKWFERKPLTAAQRKEFCEKVGLDSDRPFLTYLGSSANIAKDESWLVQEIANALMADEQLKNIQLLIRAHPSNARNFENFEHPNVRIWPKVPFPFEFGVPEDKVTLDDFHASLSGAEFILGINTSAMIEALIVDKPVISYSHSKYKATQLKAVHFRQLMKEKVLYQVSDKEQLKSQIKSLLQGKDERRPRRANFVKKYIRPMGLENQAGQLQAKAIEQLGQGKKSTDIPSRMRQFIAMSKMLTPELSH